MTDSEQSEERRYNMQLYNSLSHPKEEFVPHEAGKVSM